MTLWFHNVSYTHGLTVDIRDIWFGHLDAGTTKVMPGPRTKGTPGEHEFGGQPGNIWQ